MVVHMEFWGNPAGCIVFDTRRWAAVVVELVPELAVLDRTDCGGGEGDSSIIRGFEFEFAAASFCGNIDRLGRPFVCRCGCSCVGGALCLAESRRAVVRDVAAKVVMAPKIDIGREE